MTVLAGRYELGDVLGEGAMGRVVMAHDRVLQRDVAVKLLRGTPDAATRARFLREAQGTARLRHPNAVTVFDTGEANGQPFIVMELVRGITLAELIEREGRLELQEATAITAGVLGALAAAHAAELLHRDVKPANVILPDEGGVKLTDFGIAKAMDDATSGLTAAGTVLGTPTYLAPELIDGDAASPASDLYSVGCMLYVQLTGEPPFTGRSPLAVAYAHRNQDVPPIERLRPDLPRDVRRVVATALAKDPRDRYVDATAMREAILESAGPDPSMDATSSLPPAPASGVTATGGAAATAQPGATGSSRTDAAVARQSEPGRPPARSRSPWTAFAVGAAILFALVALALALQPGVGDGGNDGADDTRIEEPAPGAPAPDGPGDEPGNGPGDEPEDPGDPVTPAPDEPEQPDEDAEPGQDEPFLGDESGGETSPPDGDDPPDQEG